MKISNSEMTHKIAYNTLVILLITAISFVVSSILYYGCYFVSYFFDWKFELSYWLYWGITESILLIYYVKTTISSKEKKGLLSKAGRHYEDTNWMSSHVDSDYWDQPTDYYDRP